MKTMKIAHRGAKGHAPENTLSAFQRAMDLQCDAIELDVHLSADGEIIVIHDETTDRVTGTSGVVAQMTSTDIKRLSIGDTGKIPLLHEVFDLVDKNCLINVELKTAAAAGKVVALIEKYISKGWSYKHFLISSFDWKALQHVREINPRIKLGVLAVSDLELAIGFAQFIEAETIHPYFHLLTAENVAAMKAKNLIVHTWTVNEPHDIALVRSFKVNGIISDFPDRI